MKLSRNSKKLKASSLLETIIATVITTVCLSIAIVVFVQVSRTTDSFSETKASQILTKKMYNDWLVFSNQEDDFKNKNYTIERRIENKKEEKKWVEITYEITTSNKTRIKKQFLANPILE